MHGKFVRSSPPRRVGDARRRVSEHGGAHSAARSRTLAFVVMEGEAASDADQSRTQKAAVKIQRMHRQNSSSSEDADEKARRQWIKFHLENGQYEEALALGWDGDLEKNAQAPTLDGDAEDAGGAASDAADVGTGDWSEEHAAASSKIAAVRKGSMARKERDVQKKSAVAIQSRFRNRHSRVKSEGSSENSDSGEAEQGPLGGETHSESSGFGFESDGDVHSESSGFSLESGDDGGDDDGEGGEDGVDTKTAAAVTGDTASGGGDAARLSNGQRRRAAASVIAAHHKGAKRRQQVDKEQVSPDTPDPNRNRNPNPKPNPHRHPNPNANLNPNPNPNQRMRTEGKAASVIAAHRKVRVGG